jgi:hypothetical protein
MNLTPYQVPGPGPGPKDAGGRINLTPLQKVKINELVALSAALRNSVRGAADNRNERMTHLLERKFDLRRALGKGRPGAEARPTEVRGEEVLQIQEDIAQLEALIRDLDDRISRTSTDAGEARKLAERLLAHTGMRHIDFPDDSSGALLGRGGL